MASMVAPSERSRGSVLLEEVLDEGGEIADAIKGSFHRTQLWRYIAREGHYARPDLDGAALLERVTCGRVPAVSWAETAEPTETDQGAA